MSIDSAVMLTAMPSPSHCSRKSLRYPANASQFLRHKHDVLPSTHFVDHGSHMIPERMHGLHSPRLSCSGRRHRKSSNCPRQTSRSILSVTEVNT